MAIVTGVAEVVMNPNKWGKISICVDGNWYSTDPKYVKWAIPNSGDEVSFDSGGTGKYLNNLTIVGKGSGDPAKSSPAKGGYSNLGVELGHASNVAKDMANTFFSETEIGSEEWYTYWVEHTQKVYATMKKLRAAYEEAPSTKSEDSDVVVITGAGKPSSATTAAEVADVF